MEALYGLHPVEEAIKSGRRRFDHVVVAREREDARLEKLVDLCRQNGVRVLREAREQLTLLAQTPAHQGVVAMVHAQAFLTIEDLFAPLPSAVPGTARLLLALDGVEDPQNLGALLRVADGAGVDGVVLTERRSAPLSPVAVKASAGACRTSAHCARGEPGARSRRAEAPESVDYRPGRDPDESRIATTTSST